MMNKIYKKKKTMKKRHYGISTFNVDDVIYVTQNKNIK